MLFYTALVALVALAASLAPALAAGNGKIVVGYYASWVADKLTGFDFSQLTHVQLAFGIPAQDGSFAFDGDSLVPGVVSKAHAVGTKVVLSLGGWTGSYAFSPIVASAATRTTFVNNIVAYLAKYNLDGIDIDWEYPGRLGDDCNKYTASDTANYLLFLKQLRPALDAKFGAGTKLISAAVRVEPFDGADGPLADISAFVPYFDYLSIMAYDLNGSWSTTTGPNAGLNYQAGKGEPFSVAKAIATWTKAGFPAAKLVLGTPFYGHSMTATQLMTPGTTGQYSSKLATVPKGDQDDDNQWKDPCSNSPAAFSGDWAWRNLRSQGVLTAPTVAGSGWSRYWDDTTKTPWLFNNQTKVFISYDDPVSLGYKVDYAAAQGLLGVMTWALDQDNGELLAVLNKIRSGPPPSSSSTSSTVSSTSSTTSSTTSSSSSTTSSTASSTTSSSSSAPPTSSSTPCTSGQYSCTAAGTQPGYRVCVNGGWVAQSCAAGTVCRQTGSSIYCDWP